MQNRNISLEKNLNSVANANTSNNEHAQLANHLESKIELLELQLRLAQTQNIALKFELTQSINKGNILTAVTAQNALLVKEVQSLKKRCTKLENLLAILNSSGQDVNYTSLAVSDSPALSTTSLLFKPNKKSKIQLDHSSDTDMKPANN